MADPDNSVAVATGSLDVFGTTTAFIAAESDVIIINGIAAAIAARVSSTALKLKQPWPGPMIQGSPTWNLVNVGPYWQSTVATNLLLNELLKKFDAGPVKWDASGNIASRDQYNGQGKNFVYLSVDPLPFRLYVKLANTNSAADWSAGQILGDRGPVAFEEALAVVQTEVDAKLDKAGGVITGPIVLAPGSTGPIDGMSVTMPAPGAVPRKLQDKSLEFMVSVLDFGAKGDNVTDDTTSIQKAVDYAATLNRVARVYFSSMCRITKAINKPDNAAIVFEGNGPATGIRQTTPTENGINFVNTGYSAHTTGVRNMTIEAGAGYQTANSFDLGSSGVGINVVRETLGFTLQNVWVTGFGDGVTFYDVHNTENYNLKINFFTRNGLLIDSPPNSGAAGNSFVGGIIGNAGFTGDNSASTGIRVRSSGGEWFKAFDIVVAYNGVKVDPPAGKQVAYLWFHQVLSDTSVGDGWVFDGSVGSIVRMDLSSCWGAFSGGNGLVTKGGFLYGVRATNMGLRENKMRGWYHQALYQAGVDLVNPDIHSNSRGNPNVYPGVEIADGVIGPKNFSIIGGSIGNKESGTADQAESIVFAGTASYFRIQGVDMMNFGAGKVPVKFNNESNLSNYQMNNNLPLQTYGVNLSGRQRTSFGAVTGAGYVTGYFTTAGLQGTSNTAPWFVSTPLGVTSVFIGVTSPPGNGQTFTYRLVQNGIPVGATGVISGTGTYSVTFQPGVALSPGDTYEVQVVASSGAGTAQHRGYVQLDP